MTEHATMLVNKTGKGAFAMSLGRRLIDVMTWGLAALSFAVLIFALLHILIYVLINGLPAIDLKTFTEDTQGIAGGLRNALLGSLALSTLALMIAVPIGVSAGVYLSEHGE